MSPTFTTDNQKPSIIIEFPGSNARRSGKLSSSLPRSAFKRPGGSLSNGDYNGNQIGGPGTSSASISYFDGRMLDLAKDLGVPTNRREARKLAQVLNASLGMNQTVSVATLLGQPLSADNITALTNIIEDTVLRLGLHAPSRFDNWCFLLNCLIDDAMSQDCG
ncbi:MAG: hypothetical protein ABF335_06700 [Alphaproteobacteria bacterium]